MNLCSSWDEKILSETVLGTSGTPKLTLAFLHLILTETTQRQYHYSHFHFHTDSAEWRTGEQSGSRPSNRASPGATVLPWYFPCLVLSNWSRAAGWAGPVLTLTSIQLGWRSQ